MRDRSATVRATVESDVEALDKYGEFIDKEASAARNIVQKGRTYLKAMKDLETGPLTPTLKAASDRIRQIASLVGIDSEKYINMLGGQNFTMNAEQSARLALGEELDRQYTILFATNVKGNLNQSEFKEVKTLGPSISRTPEGNARIVELYERADERAAEKQRIYRKVFREAPEGQSRRVTMHKIQDEIAAYEASYTSDEAIAKNERTRPKFFNPDYSGNVDVVLGRGTTTIQNFLSNTDQGKQDRDEIRTLLLSGELEKVDKALHTILGKEGEIVEQQRMEYYYDLFKSLMMEDLGISEKRTNTILNRFSRSKDQG